MLLYDARSIGASGGLPRNQIDPIQNAEDLSGKRQIIMITKSKHTNNYETDVISYIVTLTKVDPLRIMLWGMSLGGTISACTAVFDKRVTAVLMLCPIFNIVRPDKRQSGFVQLLKDRQSPQELLQERLEDIPVMMIIPELDDISPPEIQREVFDTFKTPKKLHVAPGKEHMSILTGKGSREVLETMLEFLDLVQLPSYRI